MFKRLLHTIRCNLLENIEFVQTSRLLKIINCKLLKIDSGKIKTIRFPIIVYKYFNRCLPGGYSVSGTERFN